MGLCGPLSRYYPAMIAKRSSLDRSGSHSGKLAHNEPMNAWRLMACSLSLVVLSACAPLPADASVAPAYTTPVYEVRIATAIPSQTATPDVGPQMTAAAASLQLTNDAAYLAASNATQAAEWTAVAVGLTASAGRLADTEVAATQQAISRTQTQEPLDVAASATVSMQIVINSTATAIAENVDSEEIRANRVEWAKRVDIGWSLFLLTCMALIGIAGVCVVYYIWRWSENKAEEPAAQARALAYATRLKAEAEVDLMRDRDRLAARLRARIQEVSDRAAERAASSARPAQSLVPVQAPTSEGIEPGTYNATTELILRTLAKAASITPLGWDDPIIPPQGPAWGGLTERGSNGTRQKVVDILVENGLVRTERGQGPNRGTRITDHGTIRGLYDAIADGMVVIYDRPAPIEVTAEA